MLVLVNNIIKDTIKLHVNGKLWINDFRPIQMLPDVTRMLGELIDEYEN